MTEFTFCEDFDYQKKLTPVSLSLIKQYGFLPSLTLMKFSFSSKFEPQNPLPFLNDLFSSPDFQQHFILPDITGKRNLYIKDKQVAQVSDMFVTATHLKHLMPALSERYSGAETFKGMAPTKLPFFDMDINYLIDSALFDNTCQDYKTFTQAWREELLCSIFTLLRSGGYMNQQSEKVDDYLEPAMELYKMMVQPVRLEAEEKLTLKHVTAYQVTNLSNFELFPTNPDLESHPSNKCLVAIDGLRRFAFVLHNAAWV